MFKSKKMNRFLTGTMTMAMVLSQGSAELLAAELNPSENIAMEQNQSLTSNLKIQFEFTDSSGNVITDSLPMVSAKIYDSSNEASMQYVDCASNETKTVLMTASGEAATYKVVVTNETELNAAGYSISCPYGTELIVDAANPDGTVLIRITDNNPVSNTDGTVFIYPYVENASVETIQTQTEISMENLLYPTEGSTHSYTVVIAENQDGGKVPVGEQTFVYHTPEVLPGEPISISGLDTNETYTLFVRNENGELIGNEMIGILEQNEVYIASEEISFDPGSVTDQTKLEIVFVNTIPENYISQKQSADVPMDPGGDTTGNPDAPDGGNTEPAEEVKTGKATVVRTTTFDGITLTPNNRPYTVVLEEVAENAAAAAGDTTEGIEFNGLTIGKTYRLGLKTGEEILYSGDRGLIDGKMATVTIEPELVEIREDALESTHSLNVDFIDEVPEGYFADGVVHVTKQVCKDGKQVSDAAAQFYAVVKDAGGTMVTAPFELTQNGTVDVNVPYEAAKSTAYSIVETNEKGIEKDRFAGLSDEYCITYSGNEVVFTGSGREFEAVITNTYRPMLRIHLANEAGEKLGGATLEILDENKKSLDPAKSQTTLADQDWVMDRLCPGTYYLHESNPPKGYSAAEDIRIEIALDGSVSANGTNIEKGKDSYYMVEMINKASGDTEPKDEDTFITPVISFKKVDEEGKRLALASLRVMNPEKTKTYLTWESAASTDKNMRVNNAGTFVFSEETAPAGYEKAADIRFEVTKTGAVLVDGKAVEKDSRGYFVLEMIDKKKSDSKPEFIAPTLSFTKIDADGKRVKDAKLSILDHEKTKTMMSWTTTDSTDKNLKVNAAGSFYLRETEAPAGYKKAEDILFVIDEQGKVTVNGKEAEKNDKGYFVVPMVDEKADGDDPSVDPEPEFIIPTVSFIKVDQYGNKVSGAGLALLNSDKTKSMLSWDTTTADKTLKVNSAGTYYLSENSAPAGYEKAADIQFVVEKDGNVLVNGKQAEKNEKGYFLVKMVDQKTGSDVDPLDPSKQEEEVPEGNALASKVQIRFALRNSSGSIVADGSTLSLLNKTKSNQLTSWSAGLSDKILAVNKTGTYYFTHQASGSEVKFTVWPNGEVKVNGNTASRDSSGNYVVAIGSYSSANDSSTTPSGSLNPGGNGNTGGNAGNNGNNGGGSIGGGSLNGQTGTGTANVSEGQKITAAPKLRFTYRDSSGAIVSNSSLQLMDSTKSKTLGSWTTGATDKIMSVSYSGTYYLVDTASGSEVQFSVTTDGKVMIGGSEASKDANGNYIIGIGNISSIAVSGSASGTGDVKETVPVQALANEVVLKFRKVDSAGTYVVGANLSIIDSNGAALTSWITEGKDKELKVKQSGSFTLSETSAPDGYQIAENVNFVVDVDGSVRVNGQPAADNVIQMVDLKVGETAAAGTSASAAASASSNLKQTHATSAKTGDDSPIALYLGLALAALAVIVGLLLLRRKK